MFQKKAYKFTSSVTLINNTTGETRDLDKAVNGIAIKKSFSRFAFPLYVLSLHITKEVHAYIIQNDVDISLKIDRYTVDEDVSANQEETSNDPVIDKNITNIILHPYDKSRVYNTEETNEIENPDTSNNNQEQYISYSLNCIPRESVLYNRVIVNDCFKDANLNEIMLNIISSNYTKDIYLQESKNTDRFDSLLIPPTSLVQSLKFLQDEYSVYDFGLNVFFEDNKLYVYDLLSLNRKFNNELQINVVKMTETSDKQIYQNIQVDENDNVRVYEQTNPFFFSIHDVVYDGIGSRTVFNSYDDNFNLVTRTYNNQNNMEKTRYAWNPNRLSYFETSDVNKVTKTAVLTINNADSTMFEPDTQVTISGASLDEINGQYIINGLNIYYSTTDYVNFINSISIDLGRIK